MPLQTVAGDKDVRAPRWFPSTAQLSSVHGLRRGVSIAALIGIDCLSLLLSLLLVSSLSGFGWTLWPGVSWWIVIIACAILVLVAAIKGLYGRRHVRHNLARILSGWTIAFMATLFLTLAVHPVGIGTRYVAAWLMAGALSVAGRYVFDHALTLAFGADGDAPPVLLLGPLPACLAASPALASLAPSSRVRVVGLVVPETELATGHARREGPPVISSYSALTEALETTGATQVILADPPSLNGQLRGVLDACRTGGVALKVLSLGLHPPGDAVTYIPGLDCPLFVVRPQPAGASSYLLKQLMDRVVSLLLLVVLSPVFLIIAVLIKLTSPGPVMFVDERVGVGQRSFRFYKFRTMVEDARDQQDALEHLNEADGCLFKLRDDPRVTRTGRVLRRFSLDELPQLYNVLRGDMSLVGPRPLPLRDCALMEEWHRRRHVMLPGITGLWQVSGRSDLSFDDMVSLDLQYMDTWSLRSDLYILWRTAATVVHSNGAY